MMPLVAQVIGNINDIRKVYKLANGVNDQIGVASDNVEKTFRNLDDRQVPEIHNKMKFL